jgi:hypothetical protein
LVSIPPVPWLRRLVARVRSHVSHVRRDAQSGTDRFLSQSVSSHQRSTHAHGCCNRLRCVCVCVCCTQASGLERTKRVLQNCQRDSRQTRHPGSRFFTTLQSLEWSASGARLQIRIVTTDHTFSHFNPIHTQFLLRFTNIIFSNYAQVPEMNLAEVTPVHTMKAYWGGRYSSTHS